MELCATARTTPPTRTYIPGGCVLDTKDAIFYSSVSCKETRWPFHVLDYVFVECQIHQDVYLAKIHTIFVERKTHSMCMELQYFPVLGEIQAPGIETSDAVEKEERVVTEVFQTLALLEVDLATVELKPIHMMYVPPCVKEAETYHYVVNNIMHSERDNKFWKWQWEQEEEETEEKGMKLDENGYEKDSFIASEGTPSVYGSSDGSTASMSTKSSEEEHESIVTAYFFYTKLDLKKGEELDSLDLVPAIDPILVDLLFAYNSNVRDTSDGRYEDLCYYISKTYFAGADQKTLLATQEPRYMRMKEIVDKAIKEDNGGLIDPYEFFMTLTS